MARDTRLRNFPVAALAGLFLSAASASTAFAVDPYASNNGLYPDPSQWNGPYRSLNYDYPAAVEAKWLAVRPQEALTPGSAAAYVDKLKTFLAPTMQQMIEDPDNWDPAANGWYGMIWQGAGTLLPTGKIDPASGQEAILGSFSGQVITKETFAEFGLTKDMQNHTVIYYDAVSATMLNKLWADPFNPDRTAVSFPEGGMVVKAAGVTPTAAEWPVVDRSATWHVFRPTVEWPESPPVVVPLQVLQFDIIVKDNVAAPETGWVFITYVYDKDAPGKTPWDRLVPLGAMWGNDPQFARDPNGLPEGKVLQETWINPDAPAYSKSSLGWGGRLSGPIDVAERHNVVLTDGTRVPMVKASSCLSCHGTAQFPFVSNLYPSPNRAFPKEGTLFPMYVPGSEMWARWFQNRPGSQPQNANVGSVALDYDMLIMFALSTFDAAAGNDLYEVEHVDVH